MKNPVGPVLRMGDEVELIIAAIEDDNPDTEIEVIDRGAYVRVQGEDEITVTEQTLRGSLGADYEIRSFGGIMSAFGRPGDHHQRHDHLAERGAAQDMKTKKARGGDAMTETPARKPRPRRTFSTFGDVRRMPSEYEIVAQGTELDAAAEPGGDVRAEPVVAGQPVVPDLPGQLAPEGGRTGTPTAIPMR